MIRNITLTQAYEVMFKDYPDVVGAKDVSKMLGVCTKKVYEILRSGKIEVIPCSKTYKVAKISVIDYLLSEKNAA